MTLEDVADRLYALPPEEFTAARTAEAKADKPNGKAIAALKKPTVGAWLVNSLARAQPDLLDQLLQLGPSLADAQRTGQGDALRALGEQRRQLIGAVTSQAFEVAGRDPVAAARAEVEATLEAALVDPAAAALVRSGRLVRPLSYAGFGEVDVQGALAETADAAARPDTATAEAAALAAQGALDDAVRACETATARAEAAQAQQDAATEEVSRLEEALAHAREQRTAADAATRKAAREVDRAQDAVREAQKHAERARTALDQLRRG
ncbi:MAG: hypothetical protein LC789_02455 [Actinobacteria bacterium]|nr:hypothetical protein [Actinomycetota bacterium]MCA1720237.1 hypothetical protein [Actinomycetota bacterium]